MCSTIIKIDTTGDHRFDLDQSTEELWRYKKECFAHPTQGVFEYMDTKMTEQSSVHPYLNWAKQRIDEMDATLASLEAKAGQVQTDSKAKANELIVELKKQRDAFQTEVKKQAAAGEAAWKSNKAQFDSKWKAFEAQVKTYIDTVAKQAPQQQALFRDVAAAQVKTWREAAETIQDTAAKFAAGRRADVDAAVNKMKADAAEAEARLQKLNQVGQQSWGALSAALAESRKAFDSANQAAWDAIKKAAPPA